MADILDIHGIEGTFTQAEVMNSIQQVGFTAAIIPYHAIDGWAAIQVQVVVVFKIIQIKIPKIHLLLPILLLIPIFSILAKKHSSPRKNIIN